jgi:hypothetical protein
LRGRRVSFKIGALPRVTNCGKVNDYALNAFPLPLNRKGLFGVVWERKLLKLKLSEVPYI